MKKYTLPEYPYRQDMWDILAEEKRPIVVYGMGNGADKLFSRFEKYKIRVADVFASEGFVRGHSFRGYRVKSFSEIKESYFDFVIVLSFASGREEVIDMLADIADSSDIGRQRTGRKCREQSEQKCRYCGRCGTIQQ